MLSSRQAADVDSIVSEQMLELAQVNTLAQIQSECREILKRKSFKHLLEGHSSESLLLSCSEIDEDLNATPEPIVCFSQKVTRDELRRRVASLDPTTRQQLEQEFEELNIEEEQEDNEHPDDAFVVVPSNAATLFEDATAVSSAFAPQPVVEFNFQHDQIFSHFGLQEAPSVSSRIRSPPPEMGSEVTPALMFDETAERLQQQRKAERKEAAKRAFILARVSEMIREEKMQQEIQRILMQRIRNSIVKRASAKKGQLNAILLSVEDELKRCASLATGFLRVTEQAVVNSLNQREQTLWNHNKSACQICSTAFSWFTRPHHCRRCGRCVCNSCSFRVGWIPIVSGSAEDAQGLAVRMCESCYTVCLESQENFACESDARFASAEESCGDEPRKLSDGYIRYYVVPSDTLLNRAQTNFLPMHAHWVVEATTDVVASGSKLVADAIQAVWGRLSAYYQGGAQPQALTNSSH